MKRFLFLIYLAALFLITVSFPTSGFAEDWLQWGGPNGDFTLNSKKGEKPVTGNPKILWERPLGEGYSSILYKRNSLYTMYSKGDYEVIVSLNASTGKDKWEYRYKREFWKDMRHYYGPGPNATPLIVDDKIISIGIAGQMHCLNLTSGKLIWKRDLPSEFGRLKRVEEYGYSGSPIRYKDMVIVHVGGDQHSVIAIDPNTGKDIWKSGPGGVSYAQASVIELAGQDQFIYFTPEGVNGLDPLTGKLLWHFVIPFSNGNHLTPIVKCDDNHIFVSSQFNRGGGRLLKVTNTKTGIDVKEVWFDKKKQGSCWTLIRIGEFIYGSTGGHNGSLLSAFNWKTGEFAWKQDGYHMAQCLYKNDTLIFLDREGKLSVAKVSPEKITVRSTMQITEDPSWTLPTLVSSNLYLRDRKKIVALSLSKDQ